MTVNTCFISGHRTFFGVALLFALALGMTSCERNTYTLQLQHGDLLFQDLDCGDLCNAIETVTEGVNGKDFSHCGMVILVNDTLKVIEAIGDGVQLNSLSDFFKRSGNDNKAISVGRVRSEYSALIDPALEFAFAHLNEPYDEPFHLNNGKWYCSELLHESYKSANDGEDFFELSPMTFKDPQTNEFFPAWIDYYEDLGEEIPEGELGLNPGSISRSEKIEIIPFSISL